jgi:cell division protein ZapA
MSKKQVAVSITILDKEYQIACEEDEKELLLASAAHLNKKMREIRDLGKIIGSDRIAVMAALNITRDYLQIKPMEDEYSALTQRIGALQNNISKTLNNISDEKQHKLV